MAAGEYDIITEQGASFLLYLQYQQSDETGITLDAYTSSMQVRRSVEDDDLILHITGSTMDMTTGLVHGGSVTGGGATGEFVAGSGVAGSGQIKLNSSSSGATGTTGGILVTVDADTMASVPRGKHFYDLEIASGNTVNKVVRGRFEVIPEVTR
tara:strand:+ start:657 stop:1118 length:462 start_codon:yes stop_codon:yes gene_type:complete